MHIIMKPVAGAKMVTLRIEGHGLTINGQAYAYADLPDPLTIGYGEESGVSTIRTTDDHTVEIVPSKFVHPVTEPRPPSDREMAEIARRMLADLVQSICNDATRGYTPQQMSAWGTKASSAAALLEGKATAFQSGMIEAEASARGISADALAGKIAVNAARYSNLIGTIDGLASKFWTVIEAGGDYPAIMDQMQSSFAQVRGGAGL